MQRGIATVLILILIAAIIGISTMAYGYFVIAGNALPNQLSKQTVQLPPEHLLPSPQSIGTPECPDTDYTGCDNSSLYMTWDGSNAQTSETSKSTIIEK